MKKNVLLIGSGGREHATAEALLRSDSLKHLYVAPGNDGMVYGSRRLTDRITCLNQRVDKEKDIKKLLSLAKELNIDLVFVGPEKPLSLGIVDAFAGSGIPIVGPTKKAAKLEGSKAWAKDVMRRLSIPVPEYAHFTDPQKAKEYIKSRQYPVVVKADGLAAGKGSIVTNNHEEAFSAVDLIMKKKKFGDAGNRVVIEKRLDGEEFSFFAFTDGKVVKHMAWAKDYKPVFDNDKGLNTGGMGGFSPYREDEKELTKKVMDQIALPLIRGCKEKYGFTYKGILYIGGTFLREKGEINPYVFEINVRHGDPEAQVIYPRLKTDLIDISMAIVEERLEEINLEWEKKVYLCICATSGRCRGKKGWYKGYPQRYAIGKRIYGLEKISSDTLIFHSGSKWDRQKKHFVTAGGRVLSLVSCGNTLKEARSRAYNEIKKLYFEGIHYRRDIGK